MIQVSKKWFIDSDGRQYILFKEESYFSKKNNMEMKKQSYVSYHSTISAALTCFLRIMQKKKVKQDDMNVREAIEEFNKMESILIKSVQGREI